MTKGFRFHEHTADITIEAWGPELLTAFEQGAKATMEVMVDTSGVSSDEPTDIDVEGIDLQELLVEWIGEIIAMVDIESKFYSRFEINEINRADERCFLEATVWGESIDHDKHETRTEVKAMTYADLQIEETDEKTTVWFTLDL
jgi:SHS2 domain-containing protein